MVDATLHCEHLNILTMASRLITALLLSTSLSFLWIILIVSLSKLRISGSKITRHSGQVLSLLKHGVHPKWPFRHCIRASGSDLLQHTGHSRIFNRFSRSKGAWSFGLVVVFLQILSIATADKKMGSSAPSKQLGNKCLAHLFDSPKWGMG